MSTRLRLSAMMFLQYFIWGAWYVTMGTYLFSLKFEGSQIGLCYGATAIAAMISPFFVGYFADRFFATERILGWLHLLGGVLMFWVAGLQEFSAFYPALILYTLTYMPTLALTNSLAFHHIEDPERDFPSIRVLGTIGWIAAGLLVGFWAVEATAMPFQITGAASLLMAGYCFFLLPHTPPQPKTGHTTLGDILGAEAFGLFRDRNFTVLVVASFFVCIPLFFYYSFANAFLNEIGVANAAGKMTLGQMSEIAFMLLMPLFFRRLGVKWMILVGIAAWVARYALFAFGNNEAAVWMLYGGILLHGVCYDFFFVTGQIFVDSKAPLAIRGAAQGLITFATQGLGAFVGTWLAGRVVDSYIVYSTTAETHDWEAIWLVPAGMATVILLLFALLFKPTAASAP